MELYKAMFIVRDEGTIDGYATEHFVDISLHDFEEIYGKETREIEVVTLVKQEISKNKLFTSFAKYGKILL
ncbi:TPA: hypothetical protein LND26_002539 [Enterococcus faecium]|nr:hypothetical protein [Enterococcus faecium]